MEMKNILSRTQIEKLLSDKMSTSSDYIFLYEELSAVLSAYDIVNILKKVYTDHKDHNKGLAWTATYLLEEIQMKTLYEVLPKEATVFINDVGKLTGKETRYYQLFVVDNDEEPGNKLFKITNKVALALDLRCEELRPSGKYHSQICLSYRGDAEELIRALSIKLYDEPDALYQEVI
jgi:hypothetical protein